MLQPVAHDALLGLIDLIQFYLYTVSGGGADGRGRGRIKRGAALFLDDYSRLCEQ